MFKVMLSLFLLLAGCASPPPTSLLRMNICREPATLDPRAGGDLVSSTLHFLLFEGLVRLAPDGSLVPAQAARIDISEDKLTYTFHLKATHWSDGSLVTAQDFESAWKAALSPQFAAPNAHLLYAIKNGEKVKRGEVGMEELGLYTVDDLTLVIELERRAPHFLQLVAFCSLFPVRETPPFVSNGPFCLETWEHNKRMVLKKNPHYWDTKAIDLNEIQISMVADENTALALFEKGELDIIGRGFSPIPTEALAHYAMAGKLKTYATPATTSVCFNIDKFPFNNEHIRKAFSYAIDRAAVVSSLTDIRERAATGVNPFDDSSAAEPHNPSLARSHLRIGLEEQGLALEEFPEIVFEYSLSDVHRRLALVIQEAWKNELGIEVKLASCEHKVFLDKLSSKSYAVAQVSWIAQYNDPLSILDRFKQKESPKNYPGWENPEYVRLLNKSAYDATPEERKATLAEAEAVLMDEVPFAPIYHWTTAFLIQDHLIYPEFVPTGAFDYARIRVKR